MTFLSTRTIPLLAIVALALVLRLVFVLVLDPAPDFSGGDANWYMQNGRALVTTGKTPGPIQTAPLYPVFVGTVQVLVPGHPGPRAYFTTADMQTVRVIQSVLGAAVCGFVYLLARRLFSEGVGRLAGAILAISPALIIEAGNLTTEGLFLFFLFAALAWYILALPAFAVRAAAVAGALFGLVTLTRAVTLLFPFVLVVHLWLVRQPGWRRLAAALLTTYVTLVSTWTIYNWIVWDRFVVGGEGLLSFVHQGATGTADPEVIDSQLGITAESDPQDRFDALKEQIKTAIGNDPAGWLVHRVKELAQAYLQPHNTVYFGGESIRHAAADWLRADRTLAGLVDLTQIEAFWPKLALYIFHFGGLLLGAAGMVWCWRRWRCLFPLYGVILYFTAIHLILLALPRYLFPIYPVWWVFGAAALRMNWSKPPIFHDKLPYHE